MTPGQIAHDAGKFDRKWEHMGESKKADWERIAQAVITQEQDRILRIVYAKSQAFGKAGECMWISVKAEVRHVVMKPVSVPKKGDKP